MLHPSNYIKEYKSFINSHRLGEGVRITAGVVLPAIFFSYFNMLSIGIVIALGAMCVSITDTSGPIHHRLNGMAASFSLNFIVSLLTGFTTSNPVLLGILLVILCFILSMFGVYGSRANSIGVAALIIMVLNIDHTNKGWQIFFNSFYILAGGIWYTLMSLLLYRVRPYKLTQQILGDYILATANYVRIRASFYDKHVDYEKSYQHMLEQQIAVHEQQNQVRELLFKTRSIIKDSTNTGRTLVVIFRDTNDLFENIMTSFQSYETLHSLFDDTDILHRFQQVILETAKDLDEIGIAIKSGYSSEESGNLQKDLEELKKYFDLFVEERRTHDNIENFIPLRHILNAIEDIAERIHTLHLYTTYDKKLVKKISPESEYEKFVTHTPINAKLLFDNFSLQSNTFRHALRLSIATLCGYIGAQFLPFGHSYWILLTIIVILKPAYSLTQKRNYQRLIGTIIGAFTGLLILYFVKDDTSLFVIMIFLMIGTYSLIRTHYMWSVFLMTPYIMLLFHLLNTGNTRTILTDRIIDTGIGSFIAFLANFFLVPTWEKDQIKNYMMDALKANTNYFKIISSAYTGKAINNLEYKLSRKEAFVALANLSDAFSRMLSEPKSKQHNIKLIHQFTVLNHMLTSHVATLAYYAAPLAVKYSSQDFVPAINNTILQFEQAIAILGNENTNEDITPIEKNNTLSNRATLLMQQRKKELLEKNFNTPTKQTLSEFKPIVDQFNFITKIAADLNRITIELNKES